MKNGINRIGVILIVLLVLVGAWFFYQNRLKGGNLDIPGANIFQNDEMTNGEPTGEPPSAEQQVEDQVESDLAEKQNKDKGEVNATVESVNDAYAKGTVNFTDDKVSGWWLGIKEKGGWKVVTSGSGDVVCQDISGYDFPLEMVPTCFDRTTNRIIKR